MRAIIILSSVLFFSCHSFKKSITQLDRQLNPFGRIDTIENTIHSLSSERSITNFGYTFYINKNDTIVGLFTIDNKGLLWYVKSQQHAMSAVYYHYPSPSTKYINFTIDMTYDTLGRTIFGNYHTNGYVFRFSKKGRIVAVYLCKNNIVLRDVFLVSKRYSMVASHLYPSERRSTLRERRANRKIEKEYQKQNK